MNKFQNIGIIKNQLNYNQDHLTHFENVIYNLKTKKSWNKSDIVALFHQMIPDFGHKEVDKYLDDKM